MQHAHRLVVGVDESGFGNFVENADHADACAEVLDFAQDAAPAVGGRAHLENQLRHDREVGSRERAGRHAGVTVEGNVGTAHRVRAAGRWYGGIIAQDVAQRTVFLKPFQQVNDLRHT